MRKFVASLLGAAALCFCMGAQAAGLPSDFDQNSWNKLIAKAVASGAQTSGPSGEDLRYLGHIVPADTQQPHQADYFTVNGVKDTSGTYTPTEISIVSENWQKNSNGNWVIDQLIFVGATNGQLKSVYRGQLVESNSGQVLDSRTLASGGPDDPKEIQSWSQKIAQWYLW